MKQHLMNLKWALGSLFLLGTMVLTGCSSSGGSGEPDTPVTPDPPKVEKIPIRLSVGMQSATRVVDTAFEGGDKVGLFVVNYNGSTAGTLQSSGNHVNNMAFSYDGQWNPATPIYWKDESTPADFYLYYPYATVSNVEAHTFSVKTDQSALENYKASEFLYGKSSKIAPTAQAVMVQAAHLMSCAIVKVVAGNGFTAESLAAAAVSVKLNGCKPDAAINLRDGSLTASGTPTAITMLKEENQYRALVVPQTVNADNFITVTIDGSEFNLSKEFTYKSKTRHTFTVTVQRLNSGINVGVTDWTDDETDQGGVAE